MKPITNSSPEYAAGIVSCVSPTSWVCAETVSSPSARRSRSGELRSASTEARRTTSASSAFGQRQLDLERLGQQLPVVRELAVDAARRQPGVAGPEDDVVLVHAELDRVAAARAATAR